MDEWFQGLVGNVDGYGLLIYILLTTVISGVLSSVIGLERELKGQAAGLRTHALVTIGCCLLMSLSMYGIRLATQDNAEFKTLTYDASRIAAGILGGIGFIGAGTIVKSGGSIRGLTTAATIWLCAAIGMACGSGFILEAIVVTVVSMLFLVGLHIVEVAIIKNNPQVDIIVDSKTPLVHDIRELAQNKKLVIKNMSVTNSEYEGKQAVEIMLVFANRTELADVEEYLDTINHKEGVFSASLVKQKKHVN